jgi:hypothetical protein
MRSMRMFALVLVVSGCASAGGGGIFPEAGDAGAAISNADRLIGQAQQAGADSLAAEAMTSARQHLAEARAQQQNRDDERAAMHARMAAADASYARAAVNRALADRRKAAAQTALNALPRGGTQE